MQKSTVVAERGDQTELYWAYSAPQSRHPAIVFVHGHQLPGKVALFDSELAGLVLSSGNYDIDATYRQLDESILKQNIRRETGGASKQALRSRSVVHHDRTIRVPTMIMHGRDDDIAPLAYAVQLTERMKAVNTPVMTRFMSQTGHHIPFEKRYQTLFEFLKSLQLPGE